MLFWTLFQVNSLIIEQLTTFFLKLSLEYNFLYSSNAKLELANKKILIKKQMFLLVWNYITQRMYLKEEMYNKSIREIK